MKTQLKFAVSGKAGSGKNTFFDIAQKHFPELKFNEEKFAGPMYACMYTVQDLLGLDYHKDGKFLQFLGQHMAEKHGQNFWVDLFFANPFAYNSIITDLRFPHELEAVKKHGYTTIRIERQYELRANNLGNRDKNHISETALDKVPLIEYDYVINNNNTLQLFEDAVVAIIREEIRKHENTKTTLHKDDIRQPQGDQCKKTCKCFHCSERRDRASGGS